MDTCLFCKIVRKEIPAHIVYENNETIAFLDIHPVSRGHTLVIPKHHSTNIFDIPSDDWAHVCESVRMLAARIESGLSADGINLMMNNREHAGQVVDHPHVHLIPRYKGDGLQHWPQGSYKDGEAESVAVAIRA